MQVFLHHIDGAQSIVAIDSNTTLESILLNYNA